MEPSLRGPPETILHRSLMHGDASMGSRSRSLLPSGGTSAVAHELPDCEGNRDIAEIKGSMKVALHIINRARA